jgi:hypothetical protein
MALAYDPGRRVVVLFGGTNGSQVFNDVWEWDGDALVWRQAFPAGASPAGRSNVAFSSFDAALPGLVMFGGRDAAGNPLGDAWTWNGTVWAPAALNAPAPTARQHPDMVYDTAARRVVMYGGRDARGISFELWTANVTSSSVWPAPVSVTPSRGQGGSATFTAVYRHAGGASQILDVQFLLNSSLAATQGVAIAVPVLIHLIQKERKEVVRFPSLMFIRKIPYQSVQRRKVHNWLLLLLRAAAILLLILAFSRPFFKTDPSALAAATTGAREIVVLLDQSASMGYGDHWPKAQAEALKIVGGLGGTDKGTLVLFARGAEIAVKATSDRATIESAIRDAKVTSQATRFGPALRQAQTVLSQSTLPRKEAYLISDYQKTGWETHEEIHLPEGATLNGISVATPGASDLAISKAEFARQDFSGQDRVAVTVLLTNRGEAPVTNVPVKLDVDGHEIDTRTVSIGPNASTSVTFPPVTVAEANMRGTVRAGSDAMPADNVFHFVLTPGRPVSVLVINRDGAPADASLYVTTALMMSTAPAVRTDVVPMSRVTPSTIEHRSLIVLNDSGPVPPETDKLVTRFVEQGGGLLIAAAEHAPWTGGATAPLVPGQLGAVVDRNVGGAGTLGYLDYSHPIFEVFKQPHSGDFTAVRFHRYRALQPAPTDRVLARFDDGGVAMAERRVGAGRVIVFGSTLDEAWTDLPKRSVFVPLMQLSARYLAHYDQPETSHTVGRMLDISAPLSQIVREGAAGDTKGPTRKASGVVMSPSGAQKTIGEGGTQSIELDEQGFYSVRLQGVGERRPYVVAVNLDPAESDLTPMEPHEFVSSATGRAGVTASGQSLEHPDLTPADIEKKQAIWWFLLVGSVLALLAEAVLSNRLSKRFGVGLLQVKRPA